MINWVDCLLQKKKKMVIIILYMEKEKKKKDGSGKETFRSETPVNWVYKHGNTPIQY